MSEAAEIGTEPDIRSVMRNPRQVRIVFWMQTAAVSPIKASTWSVAVQCAWPMSHLAVGYLPAGRFTIYKTV